MQPMVGAAILPIFEESSKQPATNPRFANNQETPSFSLIFGVERLDTQTGRFLAEVSHFLQSARK
jgi:hypothetical protein